MSEARYSVRTWDTDVQAFTPQDGLSCPSQSVTLWGLKRALRELRYWGYTAHYVRDCNGNHSANDPMVLVEREK